ncbi:unnamed protein product [Alopecurus aequalis]
MAKTSWPELLGSDVFIAWDRILADRPDVSVEVHPLGAELSPGFNDKRVRIFYFSASHDVARTPAVG